MNFCYVFTKFSCLKIFCFVCLCVQNAQCEDESSEVFGPLEGWDRDKIINETARRVNSREMITNSSRELSFDPKISHPFSDPNSQARVPSFMFNPSIARRVSLNTLILSSLLYSLTILPALFTVTGYDPFGGAGIIPLVLPGIIGGIGAGRKRRSIEKDLKGVEDPAYVVSGKMLKSLFQNIVKPSQRYRKSGTV